MKRALSLHQLTQQNIETIAKMEAASEIARTFAERVSDRVAAVVGSWTFVLIQSGLLAVWVVVNLAGWFYSWDPYPFILLNLALSFQAAYTSPIIMMSQNRQARLNERRNQLDLQINLLAEQENTEMLKLLRLLCEKSGIAIAPSIGLALEEPISPTDMIRQIEKARPNTVDQAVKK